MSERDRPSCAPWMDNANLPIRALGGGSCTTIPRNNQASINTKRFRYGENGRIIIYTTETIGPTLMAVIRSNFNGQHPEKPEESVPAEPEAVVTA